METKDSIFGHKTYILTSRTGLIIDAVDTKAEALRIQERFLKWGEALKIEEL